MDSREDSEVEDGSDESDESDGDGGKKSKKKKKEGGEGAIVRPKDVDAFWLQRQLHAYESDPAVAQELAERALAAMEAAGDDDRAAETALVALLGYDKMRFVALLLRNRRTVVWCKRYAQAESDQARQDVLARLAATGPSSADLLHELAPNQDGNQQQEEKEEQEKGQQEQQPMEGVE